MSVDTVSEIPAGQNSELIAKIKTGIKSAVVRGEFEVPTLPNVTAEVMKLLSNPNVGLNQLETVIKQDPAIAARVIKTANSVMFRGAMEIASLQQAMARIGLKNVKDIVITLGVQSKAFNILNFEDVLQNIWKNSLSCATIAQTLAKTLLGDKESAFLAGLLSNIGKPVLVQICSKVENTEKINAQSQAQRSGQKFDPKTWKLAGLREEVLPIVIEELHATIGAAVGARWGLPEPVLNSIKFGTDPTKAPQQNQKLAWTVNLAQKLCVHFGFGVPIKTIEIFSDPAVAALGFNPTELNELLEDIPEQVNLQLTSLSG